jgi:hypothetical protein
MRNLISYYYGLEPNDIHQVNNYYTFDIIADKYRLQEVSDIQIDKVYELTLNLYNNGIYTHQIIKTITNEYFVIFDKKRYVLLKYYVDDTVKITLDMIEEFQYQLQNIYLKDILTVNNWGNLWSEKIDYFEYQMNQFGVKYPIIRQSFSYYIGLAEVGIALFNNYFDNNEKVTLSHKRLKKNSTLYDLYDPFNLILDHKSRDISEYFKSLYIDNNDIILEIQKYLRKSSLSNYDRTIFFIRMMFPSFYFDMYEVIMNNQKDDEPLKEIIEKSKDYNILLEQIYNELINYVNMPYISWLKKM